MSHAKRALIFDMDGTIVDNMAFHTKSWITFFERRGHAIDPDAFFRATAGRQGGEIIRSHFGADLLDDEVMLLNHEKEAVYRELYAPHRKAVEGFEDLIADAKSQGIALAVGTAAPPANVEFTLDGLDLRARGIPDEQSLLQRYCEGAGRDGINDWPVFLAFALFRSAAILQGVYARALQGNASNRNALEVGKRAGLIAERGWQIARTHK